MESLAEGTLPMKTLQESSGGTISSPSVTVLDDREGCNDERPTCGKRLYRHRGVGLVLMSAFIFAVHSVIVLTVKEGVHPTMLSWTRFCSQLLLATPVVMYKNISLRPESRTVLILLVARGFIGMLGLTSLFGAFYFTRVGDATAVMFGSPVFVGILARIFLKEAFRLIDVLLVFVVIGGVFLISQPPFLFGGEKVEGLSSQLIGILLAFFTCLTVSCTSVLKRKLRLLNVNTFKIVFYHGAVATAGTALITTGFSAWSVPSCGKVRYAIVSIGVLNFIGQCLLTYSFSLEKAVYVSILRTNEVVFVYLLEFIFFGVSPNLWVAIGVMMVLCASIATSLRKIWMSHTRG